LARAKINRFTIGNKFGFNHSAFGGQKFASCTDLAPGVGVEPTTKGLHVSFCFQKGWTISPPWLDALGVLVSSLYGAPREMRGVPTVFAWRKALAFTVIPEFFNLDFSRKLPFDSPLLYR